MNVSTDQGHLLVIDAIDGAGKSTVIRAMTDRLKSQGKKIFDLPAYMQEFHRMPEISEPALLEADVLLSAEPTYSWIGAAIREEFIKPHTNRTYDGRIAAQAFSLDRQILFSRIVLPFLRERPDRLVIQDRGVITSMVYQPLQDAQVTLDWILSLEGNQLELSRPPDTFILLSLSPEIAMQRVGNRDQKDDRQIYETLEFQKKIAARYRDPEVLTPYREAGTQIIEIDASRSPTEVCADACRALPMIS